MERKNCTVELCFVNAKDKHLNLHELFTHHKCPYIGLKTIFPLLPLYLSLSRETQILINPLYTSRTRFANNNFAPFLKVDLVFPLSFFFFLFLSYFLSASCSPCHIFPQKCKVIPPPPPTTVPTSILLQKLKKI